MRPLATTIITRTIPKMTEVLTSDRIVRAELEARHMCQVIQLTPAPTIHTMSLEAPVARPAAVAGVVL
tara:strand:- start:209 stop:412 length:204 start_codon:yes stop_codon:yes gene_type:complete